MVNLLLIYSLEMNEENQIGALGHLLLQVKQMGLLQLKKTALD